MIQQTKILVAAIDVVIGDMLQCKQQQIRNAHKIIIVYLRGKFEVHHKMNAARSSETNVAIYTDPYPKRPKSLSERFNHG